MTRVAAVGAALLLAGCAAQPPVPHGIIQVQPHPGADATFAVAIVELDGVNQDGRRASYPLAPGRHEVVVSALEVTEPTLVRAINEWPVRRSLVVDVKAGHRYTVAAWLRGPTRADWEPVLVRIEEISP